MSPVMERLHTLLGALGLSEIDALLEAHLEQAVTKEATYADLLLSLLELETQARSARALQTRMRLAGLPYCKTLAQFDFGFQPTLDEKQVRDLQTLRFAQEAHNVILLGLSRPGVKYPHRRSKSAHW